MKKFIVNKEIWSIIPNLNIGVLVLKNVKENKKLNEQESTEIKELLNNANKIATKYIESDVISENKVVKVWRETYSKFPTKKGARCSIENLLKRIIHNNPVSTILPSVDITNAISLKYALPIGAEDASTFKGDLHLGIMNGTENFIPIDENEETHPLEGEVAYKDDIGVVCRCLNWRDGKRTEITDDTTYEFIAMECVESERIENLQNAIDELEDLMQKYLGAETISKGLVNKNNKEIGIE